MNIDHLCKCVLTRRGTVCTFVDCMGDTFAVGPDGSIYPCYRFVGMPEYVMGNVKDYPTVEELQESEPAQLLEEFKSYVNENCRRCSYIRFCRGGCPYNALKINEETGKAEISGVDSHCEAYKIIFKEITDRVNREFVASSGMMPLGQKPDEKSKKPGIMSIMLKDI